MELSQRISIGEGHRNYAEVTHCQERVRPRLFGYRVEFDFKIKTFPSAGEMIHLTGWDVDLYCRLKSQPILVGRLAAALSDRPIEFNGRENSIHRYVDLGRNDFVDLVERTHAQDVVFEFEATPRFSNLDLYPKQERGFVVIPHSEWLKCLNQVGLDRFELITVRIPVKDSHLHAPFSEALQKIRQAQNLYVRGDWTGAVASCRSAWRTLLSAAPDQGKAFEHLLSGLIGDPRRKEFGLTVIRSFNAILNQGVHQEGDLKSATPPSDLAPEDALMVLQLYSVVIGYVSSVAADDFGEN